MPGFVPRGDLTDKRPQLVTKTIIITDLKSETANKLYAQPCILGSSPLGRCVLGFRPFIVGVDKLGYDTVG